MTALTTGAILLLAVGTRIIANPVIIRTLVQITTSVRKNWASRLKHTSVYELRIMHILSEFGGKEVVR